MNIAQVLSWKFPNQQGMICREDMQGVLRIVEFPGGIPTQVDQDMWTAEHAAYVASDVSKNDAAQRELDNQMALKAVALVLIDKGVFTLNELRTKYRSLS
jgi:hypothetical protein